MMKLQNKRGENIIMGQEYTTIDQLKELLKALSNDNLEDQELSTNADVIALQNILETYLINQELSTQSDLDWQDFCANLKSYVDAGYEIKIMNGEEELGTITANMLEYTDNLPALVQTKGIIDFGVASTNNPVLNEDPENDL